MSEYEWNRDCKEFVSDRACDILKENNYDSCKDCKFYDKYSRKILVIKTNQMGDVLRASSIAKALYKKYQNPHVTWLVDKISVDILRRNQYVDRILTPSNETSLRLMNEEFDILINLDTSSPSTSLANTVKAKKKYGYYMDKFGHTSFFNDKSEYYLNTALSDKLKRENRRNVVSMFFEIAELPYEQLGYVFHVDEWDKRYSEKFKEKNNIKEGDKLIGVNIGSSERWPSKMWDVEESVKMIKRIIRETDYKILILVGPQEIKDGKYEEVMDLLKKENIEFIINDPKNTVPEFATVLNLCDTIFCGDTLTMHLAVALNKKVITLFFCTPSWEIEDFPNLIKLASPLLEKYLFTDEFIKELVDSISIDDVMKAIKEP